MDALLRRPRLLTATPCPILSVDEPVVCVCLYGKGALNVKHERPWHKGGVDTEVPLMGAPKISRLHTADPEQVVRND